MNSLKPKWPKSKWRHKVQTYSQADKLSSFQLSLVHIHLRHTYPLPLHLMFLFHSILSNPFLDRVSFSAILFIIQFCPSIVVWVQDTPKLLHLSLCSSPLPSNSIKSLFRLPFRFNHSLPRGHNFKLVKKQSRLDVRKFSFSQGTINVWNKLST